MKTPFEKIVEYTAELRTTSKATLDKFQERFAANPYDALRWGDSVFVNAAQYQLAVEMAEGPLALTDRSPEDIVKAIRDTLRRDVLTTARYGVSRSSSQCSNMTDGAMLAAKALFLEKVEELLMFYDYWQQDEAKRVEEEKAGKLRWSEREKNVWVATDRSGSKWKVRRREPGSRKWVVENDQGLVVVDRFTDPDSAKAWIGDQVRRVVMAKAAAA